VTDKVNSFGIVSDSGDGEEKEEATKNTKIISQ